MTFFFVYLQVYILKSLVNISLRDSLYKFLFDWTLFSLRLDIPASLQRADFLTNLSNFMIFLPQNWLFLLSFSSFYALKWKYLLAIVSGHFIQWFWAYLIILLAGKMSEKEGRRTKETRRGSKRRGKLNKKLFRPIGTKNNTDQTSWDMWLVKGQTHTFVAIFHFFIFSNVMSLLYLSRKCTARGNDQLGV